MAIVNCPYCDTQQESDLVESLISYGIGLADAQEFPDCINCRKQFTVYTYSSPEVSVAAKTEDEWKQAEYDELFGESDDYEPEEDYPVEIDERDYEEYRPSPRVTKKPDTRPAPNYSDLLKEKDFNKTAISYQELLNCIEWKIFRNEVLEKDGHRCTVCEKRATEFNEDSLFSDCENEENWTGHYWMVEECESSIYSNYFQAEEYGTDAEGNEVELALIVADKPYHLHAHHKFYNLDKLPWEYDSVNDMSTMCTWCHADFHSKNTVTVYKSSASKEEMHYTPCSRCNGAGILPEYRHVEDGICFRCHGFKFEERI